MKYLKVFLFGIFAGLAIGLGSLVFTVTSAYLADAAGKMFASACNSLRIPWKDHD